MMMRCTNQKINEAINQASAKAVEAFLKTANENTQDVPEGDVEGIILINTLIIGVAKIMANTIYLTMQPDRYEDACDAFQIAAKENCLVLLSMKNKQDDDSTV